MFSDELQLTITLSMIMTFAEYFTNSKQEYLLKITSKSINIRNNVLPSIIKFHIQQSYNL